MSSVGLETGGPNHVPELGSGGPLKVPLETAQHKKQQNHIQYHQGSGRTLVFGQWQIKIENDRLMYGLARRST